MNSTLDRSLVFAVLQNVFAKLSNCLQLRGNLIGTSPSCRKWVHVPCVILLLCCHGTVQTNSYTSGRSCTYLSGHVKEEVVIEPWIVKHTLCQLPHWTTLPLKGCQQEVSQCTSIHTLSRQCWWEVYLCVHTLHVHVCAHMYIVCVHALWVCMCMCVHMHVWYVYVCVCEIWQ